MITPKFWVLPWLITPVPSGIREGRNLKQEKRSHGLQDLLHEEVLPPHVFVAQFSAAHAIENVANLQSKNSFLYSAQKSLYHDVFSPSRLLPTVYCEEAKHLDDSYDPKVKPSHSDNETWYSGENGSGIPSLTEALLSAEHPKVYKVTLRPIWTSFTPQNLFWVGLKAMMLNFTLPLQLYLLQVIEELEKGGGDKELPPLPDLQEAAEKTLWTALREIAVTTTRRVLEILVIPVVSPRFACKLIKDFRDSAVRKASRGIHGWTIIWRMTRTTVYSYVVGIVAQVVVEFGLGVYLFASRLIKGSRASQLSKEQFDTLLLIEAKALSRRIFRKMVVCSAALLCSSLGAGIGSSLKAGKGTYLGFVLGDMIGPHVAIHFLIRKL